VLETSPSSRDGGADGGVAALTGVRVLDFTHHLTGPYATKLLADNGADVIKIERPGNGDPARQIGPFFKDKASIEGSGVFLHLNTSKRSVVLDLKSTAGREAALRLVRSADIVVQSFAPRVMPSLGLGYDVLKQENPRLVMTSISNFGQTGPYRDYKMSELTMYALGGTMFSSGLPGREPVKLGLTVEQIYAGMVAAAATLGAYWAASASGTGQHVDLSLFELMVGNQDRALQSTLMYQYTGEDSKRSGPGSGRTICPNGVYPASDGYVQFFALVPTWDRVCEMIERPDLVNDPHFTAPENFSGNAAVKEEFDAILLEWMLAHTKAEVLDRAQHAGYPSAPLNRMDDVFRDPHLAARNFFVELEHPHTGRLKYPGAPFRMDASPWRPRRAPLLGEHTDEVLRSAGYIDAEIVSMSCEGVV